MQQQSARVVKMSVRVLVVAVVGVVALASPMGRDATEGSASPIHIIKPPVRCPEGMKPDANGRCRVVWDKSLHGVCPEGEEVDADGVCRQTTPTPECFGDDCPKRIAKREDGQQHRMLERLEAPNEKKSKKRSNLEKGRTGKQERSKHAAFLMMLKKKKMQMMKPKPPPPPPHHPHHPPHHEGSEEPPEEEPAEEDTPAPERMFFGDETCLGGENATAGCEEGAEVLEKVETDDFKEWKSEKSSDSSESSDSSSSSSSSSDSVGQSDSVGGSDESEDEVLQKAIKIKLMKLFRMKQRYGPALRRWLATQLREYEDSLDY